MYLVSPVVYLESKDFTSSGNLKRFKNKTCVVMLQANYCGHCTSAKPMFQNFANKQKGHVVCLTIQGDADDESEKMLSIVSKLKPGFQGFPDYLLFKNGKYIEKEINGRNESSLEEFLT